MLLEATAAVAGGVMGASSGAGAGAGAEEAATAAAAAASARLTSVLLAVGSSSSCGVAWQGVALLGERGGAGGGTLPGK